MVGEHGVEVQTPQDLVVHVDPQLIELGVMPDRDAVIEPLGDDALDDGLQVVVRPTDFL